MENRNIIDPYVGQKIKEFRKKLGWTLSEMGRMLDISAQQVQKYEQGKTRISVAALYKISLIMAVEYETFFEGFSRQRKLLPDYKPKEKMPRKRLRPLDVLLVQKDQTEVLVTRRAIEKSSVDVNLYLLQTAKMALSFLRQDCNVAPFPRPELIILELDPYEDTLWALREFKRDRSLNDIPVVVLAGSSEREDMIKCYKNNASGFIRKPIRFREHYKQMDLALQYWADAMILPQMDHAETDPLEVELAQEVAKKNSSKKEKS